LQYTTLNRPLSLHITHALQECWQFVSRIKLVIDPCMVPAVSAAAAGNVLEWTVSDVGRSSAHHSSKPQSYWLVDWGCKTIRWSLPCTRLRRTGLTTAHT